MPYKQFTVIKTENGFRVVLLNQNNAVMEYGGMDKISTINMIKSTILDNLLTDSQSKALKKKD